MSQDLTAWENKVKVNILYVCLIEAILCTLPNRTFDVTTIHFGTNEKSTRSIQKDFFSFCSTGRGAKNKHFFVALFKDIYSSIFQITAAIRRANDDDDGSVAEGWLFESKTNDRIKKAPTKAFPHPHPI